MLEHGLQARIASALRPNAPKPGSTTTGLASANREPRAAGSCATADSALTVESDGCTIRDYPLSLTGAWGSEIVQRLVHAAHFHIQGKFAQDAHRNDAPPREVAEIAALLAHGAERLAFIDCETAGSAGILPIFLIGASWVSPHGVHARQWLARDYAAEPAALAAFAAFLSRFEAIVSYNGKSFDMPYLHQRCRFHRIPFSPPSHYDLLKYARRRWKGVLPNCKLQTIERELCGRRREDDVPGAQVPELYHQYVHTGNAALLAPLWRHNWLDLLTLMEVLCLLIESDGCSGDGARGA